MAFDVDGTLLRGDSFLAYLVYVLARRPSRWLRAPFLAWGVGMFAVGRRDNTWLKTWFVRHVLAGLGGEREAALTGGFLAAVGRRKLKARGLERIGLHRGKGDTVILISAGLDTYLIPLGARLGVDGVVCTRAERDAKGKLTGRLDGQNCYGAEKVRRLDTFLAEPGAPPELTVYCDHHSDLPLLLRADAPVAVDPTRRLRALSREHGFGIEQWAGRGPDMAP